MKKIFLVIITMLISFTGCDLIYAQVVKYRIGNTVITDSTNYTKFNKGVYVKDSLYVEKDLFIKYGKLYLDTTRTVSMYLDNGDFNILNSNNKTSNDFNISTRGNYNIKAGQQGEGDGERVRFIGDVAGFEYPWLDIDSTGINLLMSGMHFFENGTPITSGSANLYGYFYKDSVFTANQHFKAVDLTLFGSGSDSVQFTVRSGGHLLVNPVGSSVTFGSTVGVGTKTVSAGEYYRGTVTYLSYLMGNNNTWTGTNGFAKVSTTALSSTVTTISSTAIDWSLSNMFKKTLGANTTFTFSNGTDGQIINVWLTNTASNYTVTWPGGVVWSGGTAPVQTIGAKTDVYSFIKDGSVYYGSVVQNF